MNEYIMKILASFILGTLFGSFFYTLSLRFSHEESGFSALKSLLTRSKCPACGKTISTPALVPIIGYIIIRGRCSNCKSKIPLIYPALEVAYGFLGILTFSLFGFNLYSFNIFILIGLAVSLSIIDIKTMTIPDSLVVAFIVLSLYPVIMNGSLKDNLFGMMLMIIFFLVVLLIFPGSFGGGDLKFAGAIGLLLGLELSIVALEISLIIGAISGIAYALISGKGLKSKIAFGPFLTMGLVVTYIWGRDIIVLYYSWIY